LKSVGEATAKQLEQKARDYGQSQAKIDDLQTALDRAWTDLNEQKRIVATSKTQNSTLFEQEREKLKLELEEQMKQMEKKLNEKETTYLTTIQELRLALQNAQQQFSWKEDQLTNEISVRKLKLIQKKKKK